MIIILILILLVIPTWTQPTCQWECDEPTCFASCKASCKTPACNWNCPGGIPSASCGRPPSCFVSCPDPVANDTLQSCPACETKCEHVTCTLAGGIVCPIACQETECSWSCKKPDDCQSPTCELQCNAPACVCDGVNYPCSGMKGQLLSLVTIIGCLFFTITQ